MSLLSCNCLNIQIPIERTPMPEPQSPQQLIPTRDFDTISSLVSKKNHIFSSKLIRLLTSFDNIRIKVQSLAALQKLGTWVIVRCLNCHIDCYMFDRSPHTSSVYANSQLSYNPDHIKTLSDSSDLSPAFGIVIRPHPNSADNRDSDVDVSQILKEQVREYISQAKRKTEERINEFTENEMKRLSALERRAWSDFNNVLTNIEKEPAQLSMSTTPSMSPPHLSPAVSYSSSSQQEDLLPSLTDSEDLPFELDGFEARSDSNVIQDSSEDEDEDSDCRSETSEFSTHFSRSMPINITATALHASMNNAKVEHIRLDDIHNSMKMLAQSVTEPHYRDLPLPGHYQRSANHI